MSCIKSVYLNSEKNKNEGSLYEDNELTHSMNVILPKKGSNSIMKRNLSSSLSNSSKFEMRAFKSFRKIPKLVGILKNKRRKMFKNNSDIASKQRRVSFGWREESF